MTGARIRRWSQGNRLFQRPRGNRAVTAGPQGSHAIGEGCDPGGRPFGDQPVHEGCGECIAGSDSVGDSDRVALRFDIVAVGENGTAACAEGNAYGPPAVAACSFAAECFGGAGGAGELLDALQLLFVYFDGVRAPE